MRAETALAEKFLRAGNLQSGHRRPSTRWAWCRSAAARRSIETSHKALLSIRDVIDRHGTVEGQRLIDIFSDAPFGWSPDTLRYLVAALLVAGEIKLKVSGREVTVNGQQAIEALRTNNSFKPVGVALRAWLTSERDGHCAHGTVWRKESVYARSWPGRSTCGRLARDYLAMLLDSRTCKSTTDLRPRYAYLRPASRLTIVRLDGIIALKVGFVTPVIAKDVEQDNSSNRETVTSWPLITS